MIAVLLIIHLLIIAAMVTVILMQRSEGGALGIGGGGPGGMMSGRGAANLLTRSTMILGALFVSNSILLAVLASVDDSGRSVIDRMGGEQTDQLPFDFTTMPDDEADGVAPEVEIDDTPAPPPVEDEPEIPGL
ncbi:MAG: preprotein translocase subunit SecG [Oceanicaulis sp.]